MLNRNYSIGALFRQLQFANVKEDVKFRAGHCQELEAGVHHLKEAKLYLNIYNDRKIEVMRSEKSDVVWNEMQEGMEKFFVRYSQIATDKTATTVKWSGLAVYAGPAVLLNILNRFRRSQTRNVLTQTGFLPVRCSGRGKGKIHEEGQTDRLFVYGFSRSLLTPRLDSVCLISTRTARGEKMIVLHEAMHSMLRPFCESA